MSIAAPWSSTAPESLPTGVEDPDVVARLRIDAEIMTLSDDSAILALKSRRNMHSKICRLPAEILLTVFAYLYLAQPKIEEPGRIWRQTALYCPTLWSRINTLRIDESSEYLLRSMSAPLDVFIDYSHFPHWLRKPQGRDERIASLVGKIMEQSHRISNLKIFFPRQYDNEAYSKREMTRRQRLLEWSIWTDDSISLHSVRMTHFQVPWNASWLRQLTSLELSYLRSPFTPSTLLSLFRNCPALQTFRLQAAGPVASDDGIECQASVLLAHLSSLSVVQAHGHPWSQTLSKLVLPVVDQWNVSSYDHSMDGSMDVTPRLALSRHQPCQRLYIKAESMTTAHVEIAALMSTPDSTQVISRDLRFYCDDPTGVMQEVIRVVRDAYSDAPKLDLSIGFKPGDDMQHSLEMLLKTLPDLTQLSFQNRICSRHSTETEKIFAAVLGMERSDGSVSLVCPKLAILGLDGFNLDPKRGDGLACLMTAIRSRIKAAPIKQLHIQCCNGMSSLIVAKLQQVVETVEWDDFDRWPNTEESEEEHRRETARQLRLMDNPRRVRYYEY